MALPPKPVTRLIERDDDFRRVVDELLEVPAFAVDGKAVAGDSAAKNHCSYLPMSGSVLAKMADALAGYQWSKGALRFAVDEPLPADLIGALVDARLAEVSR